MPYLYSRISAAWRTGYASRPSFRSPSEISSSEFAFLDTTSFDFHVVMRFRWPTGVRVLRYHASSACSGTWPVQLMISLFPCRREEYHEVSGATHVLLKVQTRPIGIHTRSQQGRQHIPPVLYQLLWILRQRYGVHADDGEEERCGRGCGTLEV